MLTWAEEHHIAEFDTASFFTLHDYNGDGQWDNSEILRTYGLMDVSNRYVPQERKDEIIKEILGLFDLNHDGAVTKPEFESVIQWGKTMPDMGTGPGHHGDDETEYEIHHFEK